MTKIVWSLDTLPIMNNRWQQGNKLKETIIMYALSILYAHLWYDDLEVYTDEIGYEYLKELPIRVTKIDFNSDKGLWMDSKLKVLELQRRPFIHIDGDVFLQKPIQIFHNLSKPIIIERYEMGEQFGPHYKGQVNFLDDYLDGILRHWNKDLGYSVNCGVIGFSDITLKDEFIEQYKLAKSIYSSIYDEYKEFNKVGYEPCIVLEQYNLACFLDYKSIKPYTLLSEPSINSNTIFAKRLGYCHLYGVSKYEMKDDIENRLQIAFPYWYDKLMSKF